MRVNINFQNITNQINSLNKKIINGGYDNNIYQKIDLREKEESISKLNQFKSANNSIQEHSKLASDILLSVDKDLDKMRELIIEFSDGTTSDKNVFKSELKSIIEGIEDKLNFKDSNGYLFSGTKRDVKPFSNNNYYGNLKDIELLTSDGIKNTKIEAPSFLVYENSNIIKELNDIVDNLGNMDLTKIDQIKNKLTKGIVEYGLNETKANHSIKLIDSQMISTEDLYEQKYKHLEKYIGDLNNSIIQYQTMAEVVSRTEKLSLVNYI
jgi:flagellin-like hook-associated protein FlgL